MNVLSLFNGFSGGKLALETLGVEVGNYYSSEIDKYANQATQAMFPDTIQLGSVTDWREWDIDWASIDLVTGGFPCQAWSMAGKQLGDKDERGMLFWVMLDIMKHVKHYNPKVDFLIENVKMKKEFEEYITTHTENALGHVHKTLINSALLSAQNRNRHYWTSFAVNQPESTGVKWGDVREHGVDGFYYTEKGLQWLARHSQRKDKQLSVWGDDEKAQMVEASHYKNYSAQRFFGVCDAPTDESMIASMRGRRINEVGSRSDYDTTIKSEQYIEFKYDEKSNCISTVQKDNIVVPFTLPNRIPVDLFFFRYITPRECFRLQTVPEHHIDTLLSAGISNTQLYKMAGNGWTIDVIAHILKGIV
tara:strand:- start:7734 stop:8819 length:1086 start_codon:yes stop_codon:yes gene_type:complete